jgi:hypothetical protein
VTRIARELTEALSSRCMGWSKLTNNKKGTVPYMDRLPRRKILEPPTREKSPGADDATTKEATKTKAHLPAKSYETTPQLERTRAQ